MNGKDDARARRVLSSNTVMRRPRHTTSLVAAACAAAVLAWSGESTAAWEGVTFGVEDFGTCAPGFDRNYLRDFAESFSDGMTINEYDTVGTPQMDAAVDGVDFIEDAWGGGDRTSPTGTDWADTVFAATLGGITSETCSGLGPSNYLVVGDGNSSTCMPHVISVGSTDMRFAEENNSNSELNYLVLAASYSAQYCLLLSPGIFYLDGHGSGTQFQLLDGFHGHSWDSQAWIQDFYDYVVGAKNNGIGDDFIDVFGYTPAGSDNDVCPMSVGLGDNVSEVEDVLIYGGFNDAHDSGTHDEQWARIVCSCDPPGGPALPGC